MVNRNCYVCGGARHHEILRQECDDSYLSLIDPKLNRECRAIVVCENCGFVFHSPTLTDEEIAAMYERFRDADFRKETPDHYFDRITSLPKEESLNYQKVQKLNLLMAKYGPARQPRTIYDVGIGGGVFVKTFLDYAQGSWTAYGVEPTRSYAELAARRLGIPVKSQFYEPQLFGHRFDLITAIKVIEHARNPIAFLKGLRQDLQDDGIVYVEVPNMKELFSLPADHDQLLYTHLYFYSDRIFEHLCRMAGFQIVWTEQTLNREGDWDLNSILRKDPAGSTYACRMPLYDYREILGMRRSPPHAPERPPSEESRVQV
ncbi:MAG: class I SAM-dependent methyltransferase [Candidatus Binatia bacterium]